MIKTFAYVLVDNSQSTLAAQYAQEELESPSEIGLAARIPTSNRK